MNAPEVDSLGADRAVKESRETALLGRIGIGDGGLQAALGRLAEGRAAGHIAREVEDAGGGAEGRHGGQLVDRAESGD